MSISFDTSDKESDLIAKIVNRAESLALELDLPFDRMNLHMDVTACHANGCPLLLDQLLHAAENSSFAHDVWGISRHIDRRTGKLTGCFLPRYAA